MEVIQLQKDKPEKMDASINLYLNFWTTDKNLSLDIQISAFFKKIDKKLFTFFRELFLYPQFSLLRIFFSSKSFFRISYSYKIIDLFSNPLEIVGNMQVTNKSVLSHIKSVKKMWLSGSDVWNDDLNNLIEHSKVSYDSVRQIICGFTAVVSILEGIIFDKKTYSLKKK